MARIPTGLSSDTNKSNSDNGVQIRAVRVKFVSLNGNDYPITWKKYGEYNSIGGILFEDITNPSDQTIESLQFALPLYSNISFLPLINEIVYLISLPTSETQKNVSSGRALYYFQSINIWNSIHHNALPNTLVTQPTNAQKYTITEAGVEIQSDVENKNINLGRTFKERPIRNLQPYEGDVLLEGRWGNTLRLGSTVNNSAPLNPWSNSGVNGEPITIIKNGQTETEEDPWVPQVENINTDKSSIYLTSNQTIPIGASNTDYSSYTPSFGETPTSPSSYNGSQVIVNSGRLLFNSKSDHILLSSARTISFGAQKGFNFDTPSNFVVKVGTKIMLGDKEESTTEPLILGDKFLKDFQKLLTNVISLTSALGTVGTPIPFTPNVAVAQTATKVGLQAQTMLSSIEFYKSKTTRTL